MFFLCLPVGLFAQTNENHKFKSEDEKSIRAAIIKIESSPGGLKLDENFTYASKYVDLNGDGRDEIIVWIPEDNMGGTSGYPILVLSKTAKGYRKLMDIDQGWTPVIALHSTQNGWRNIAIQIGGGGAEWQYLIYKFNGKTYQYAGAKKLQPPGEMVIEKNWDQTTFGPIPN